MNAEFIYIPIEWMVRFAFIYIFRLAFEWNFLRILSKGRKERERENVTQKFVCKIIFFSLHCDVWLKIGDRWSEMTEVRNDELNSRFMRSFFAYLRYMRDEHVHLKYFKKTTVERVSFEANDLSHQFPYCNAFISFVSSKMCFFVNSEQRIYIQYFEWMLDIFPCSTVHNFNTLI